MKILLEDYKKEKIRLQPQNQDDLWLLSELIVANALVTSKTTRKVALSETKVVKKVYIMTLSVDKVTYDNEILRISGTVQSEHEDIPKGSAHSFSIAENDDLTISQQFFAYQQQQIKDATKEKHAVLLIVMDRESVYFAQVVSSGYKVLSSFAGDVQKKVEGVTGTGSFYKDIIKVIEEYDSRYDFASIILASPSFFKEDLYKLFTGDLKKKTVLATCSDVSERAFSELLKRDEIKQALKDQRVRDELLLVEQFFSELGKNGKCAYGYDEVFTKAQEGAVINLLISTKLMHEYKSDEIKFVELQTLLKTVEDIRGTITIVSSENEAGKKLDGIAGIAAILRY